MSSVVGRKDSMSRLLVHVEGETEERFVNRCFDHT